MPANKVGNRMDGISMNSLVKEAKESLSARGGRMTAQRRLILDALEGLCDHPTAEELYETIKDRDPTLNLSTVYRTLRWLEQDGLVVGRRFRQDRGQQRFDTAIATEHSHFVCSACRQVIEFNSPLTDLMKVQFEEKHSAQIDMASVVLYGLCEDCIKANRQDLT